MSCNHGGRSSVSVFILSACSAHAGSTSRIFWSAAATASGVFVGTRRLGSNGSPLGPAAAFAARNRCFRSAYSSGVCDS